MIRCKHEGRGSLWLDALKDYLGAAGVLFLSSGRAALWLILKTLSEQRPERREVIIPAYTCPAVASATLKAGLEPVLCDINLEDYGYSSKALARKISRRTLAVVVVHLFGCPANTKDLIEWGRQQGFFIVEDGAQAFGNTDLNSNGTMLGMAGDVGFFSFGRGKPLSVLHGGLVATKSEELYHELGRFHEQLGGPPRFEGFKFPIRLALYNLFSSPHLYWIPQNIPSLHLGETLFEHEFSVTKGLNVAIGAIHALLASFERDRKNRAENSSYYSRSLGGVLGVKTPLRPDYPYLRYPLMVTDKGSRDELLVGLVSQGAGAAPFYPCPLNKLEHLREILRDPGPYPNAAALAETLLTLPVHEGLVPTLRRKIVSSVKDALCRSGAHRRSAVAH
jgi:perosamine synthetase